MTKKAMDDLGHFPFDQNFRNFRSETEWNGKNSSKSFRKFRNTFVSNFWLGYWLGFSQAIAPFMSLSIV